MENARDCFTKLCESFAKWDRDTLSWKTFQRSLLEEWETFSDHFPRSGSMLSGKLYRRNQWERVTVETECSLSVGTPTASMSKRSEAFRKGRLPTPAEAAETWPTPSAQEPGIKTERLVDKNGNPPTHPNQRLYDKETGRLCQKGLTQAVEIRETWPTPIASEAEKMSSGTLSRAVRPDLVFSMRKNGPETFPTPASSNAKGCPKKRFAGSEHYRGNLDEAVRTSEKSPQLSPHWVEWLMGFPSGWTNLESDEPPSAWSNVATVSDASETQ